MDQIQKTRHIKDLLIEQGFERLIRELSTCEGPDELVERTGTEISRLLKPESCAVYARSERVFSPVFAQGRVVPPAFERDGPLIRTLEKQEEPLASERFSDRRGGIPLSPFDRAALDTLGVPVVVPEGSV